MRKITALFILLFCLSSCSKLLHRSYKVQRDNRLFKTEKKNFETETASIQWWYYDCFFDDGSVLVLMFVPHHWWNDPVKVPDAKTLVYVSYMQANGEVLKVEKQLESSEVSYTEDTITCKYLEIVKGHGKKGRAYTITFKMPEISGTVKIASERRAFSPIPRGSMGKFGTRAILHKGKGLAYRYSAHVPQGDVTGSLGLAEDHFDLKGTTYHEQGWFTGQAHEMGDGWVWFHFTSENINLFGARSFFYLEVDGKRVIGGLNSGKDRCLVTDTVFAESPANFLMGAKLSYDKKKLNFEVATDGSKTTRLVCIPAEDTDQVWGTAIQRSKMRLYYKGEERIEDGNLILETCMMKR